MGKACQEHNVTEATFDEYKQKYGKKKVSTWVKKEEMPELFGDFSFHDAPVDGTPQTKTAGPEDVA